MATKHRMMINVDRAVYEWIRDHAHARRSSMSSALNELVKTEMTNDEIGKAIPESAGAMS